MPNIIQIKRGSGKPSSLVLGEFALDTTNKRLYIQTGSSSSDIKEVVLAENINRFWISQEDHRVFTHLLDFSNVEFDFEVIDVLTIPMPSGYPGDPKGEVIHVDIFHKPEGKFGCPFWVVYSPYPNFSQAYENPCIAYSLDGINFSSDDIENPIIQPPSDPYKYNSDPCIFELDNGDLCVINRVYEGEGMNGPVASIHYTTSSDGKNWSNPISILSSSYMLSPSVIKDANCGSLEFAYYSVEFTEDTGRKLRRRSLVFSPNYTSASLSDPIDCSIEGLESSDPWHVTIRFVDGQYLGLLIVGYSNFYDLYLIASSDGIHWKSKKLIAKDEIIGQGFPYRGDFIVGEDGSLLIYLPFALRHSENGNTKYNSFLYVLRAVPRLSTEPPKILKPPVAYISSVDDAEGAIPRYPANSKVHFFICSIDDQEKESHKYYVGYATLDVPFIVAISVSDEGAAKRYRLYRSLNQDSRFDFTHRRYVNYNIGTLYDDNDTISFWSNISGAKVSGNGGTPFGWDGESFYINRNLKVGNQLEIKVTDATPLKVYSTVKVDNLNADLLDGNHASDFALVTHNHDDRYSQLSHTHTLLSLTDTPSSYSGQAGKYLRVKSDESGLEFATVSGSQQYSILPFPPKPPGINDSYVPYAMGGAGATTLTLTSNRTYWIPFVVWATISISQIMINVTTASSGTHWVGIYNSNNLYQPNALLVQVSFDAGSTGVKTRNVTVTLQPGVYWVAWAAGSAASVRAVAITACRSLGLPNLGTANTTYYYTSGNTLPSIAPTSGYASATGSAVPAVGFLWQFIQL